MSEIAFARDSLGCSPCSAGRLKNTQCLLTVNGRGCVFQVPASRHFLYVAYNLGEIVGEKE